MQKYLYAYEAIKKRGLLFLWVYFWESILFDILNGTKTSARVPKDQQSIDANAQEGSEGLLYVASFSSVVKESLLEAQKYLGNERFNNSQFFDLGCGKGKALFVYSKTFQQQQQHPAIGIEYDPVLTEIARENSQRCGLMESQVKIFTDSALNIKQYVESDNLIVYIYNSFQGETLKGVLTTLNDVPHILIYVDPFERDMLPEFSYKIIRQNKGRYNADTWLIASRGFDSA